VGRGVEALPGERPQTPLRGGTVDHLGTQLTGHMVVCHLYCDKESARGVCVCVCVCVGDSITACV